MKYVLDTNVVSDLLRQHKFVNQRVSAGLDSGDTLILCQPVYFEVMRGLLWKKASAQQRLLSTVFRPMFVWAELIDDDWDQATRYWEQVVRSGRQLADMDLLIASIASRMDAIVVTSDEDFTALPVPRENWRLPSTP